jgi:SAM-dependent methyltransferase
MGQGLCPRCFSPLETGSCSACGLGFERLGDGLIDVVGARERERAAAAVERFYERSPFPGYGPADDAGALLDRSRRSAFLVALDRAVDVRGRVLDCGCGTAQLAAFLALAAGRRTVFGVDGCRASLACAEGFRARVGLQNLQLVRADLFDLPIRDASFEVVICRGVVHHTPDPARAIRSVARCVAPGGVLVLGFYESWARLFHRARQGLARLLGRPVAALDPLLRSRALDPEKARIWIDDQYRHPLEHVLPLPFVQGILEAEGLRWVRAVPPAAGAAGLFEATPRPSGPARAGLRVGWLARGFVDPDAGCVCVIAERQERV